ncbi:hypothetical protein HYFRA_00012812 [Hymenoscyphus fraxineus]|uniref:Amidase domain-containing protein n=1 Tax=Hymenoscyphus fraxineus TaxID=746836 RepID=A0A9N9Q013_9HELO|nr:hypothetical protein HYFRA_00012812 [Hymenoscyphus fraxineus]
MAPNSWITLTAGPYHAYPKTVGVIYVFIIVKYLPFKASTLKTVTVLQSTGLTLNDSWAEKIISEFINKDDVLNLDFLQVVIVTYVNSASAKLCLEPSAIDVLNKHAMQNWEYASVQSWKAGPYFTEGQNLFQAWRLYEDTLEAFHLTIIPNTEHDSSSVFSSIYYFSVDKGKALHGARIAVKDIYNLKGAKTAGSSRSYRQLYRPSAESVSSVPNLIDFGAIIVGKTKTTTFADREIPTGELIDTHAPFNPRGDGYIVPGGCRSGSGSALTSYDWLDYAIGTDN